MQTTVRDGTVFHEADRKRRSGLRLVAAVALVAAADFLFYGHAAGISVSVFALLLALAALIANPLPASRSEWTLAAVVLALSFLPAAETFGLLPLLFALSGAAAFALIATGNARAPWPTVLGRLASVLAADIFGIRRRYRNWRQSRKAGYVLPLLRGTARWLAPLAVGLVFVALFSVANPIFQSWVLYLNPLRFLLELDLPRFAFWLLVALFVSTFVAVPVFAAHRAHDGETAARPVRSLGEGLVIRCLLICNAVFALQTVLDLVYLWGGADLPDGVTPAANAQEAAYLLVASALLAAAFVLLALRGAGERNRLIRTLVYLWIGQNVVLVLSAILRLDLYVEMFSLTRLRLAAFIWMGLVAAGLILIVARIVLARSNGWLVKANLIALGIALYACSLIDRDAIIAQYNVAHSRELSGQGVRLDQEYLCSLGPSALPAIEIFMGVHTGKLFREPVLAGCAGEYRLTLSATSPDWRAWTWRGHRLRLYSAATAAPLVENGHAIEDPDRR